MRAKEANLPSSASSPATPSPRKAAIAQYFDSIAFTYELATRLLFRLMSWGRLSSEGAAHWLAERLALRPGMCALDLGCGAGRLSLALAQKVGPTGVVIGLDISSKMLHEAEKRARSTGFAHLIFQQADAERLESYGDGSFDAIGCQGALHFFEQPQRVLREAARLLPPRGRLGLLVPVSEGLLAAPMLRVIIQRRMKMALPAGAAMMGWLKEAGLEVVARRRCGSLLLLVAERPSGPSATYMRLASPEHSLECGAAWQSRSSS